MTVLILVVDDEPDVEMLFRQQFRRDLRSGRFLMEFAQSAPAALQCISDARTASLILILSDINILVYAHRADAVDHGRYATWLDETMDSEEAFGISAGVDQATPSVENEYWGLHRLQRIQSRACGGRCVPETRLHHHRAL